MIAAPDRTPLTRDLFDRPVLEAAPDLPERLLARLTSDGPPGRVHVYFTCTVSGRSA
ncbi:3-methyladenine DNA glycosylase [Streptomyces sp. NPDC021080]|uniref:3-methyladenine DNA glycosylase n=1 Tax=Streptomyces sp. NPDC021080 TaxID=3365110 RepID=UPI00379D5A99